MDRNLILRLLISIGALIAITTGLPACQNNKKADISGESLSGTSNLSYSYRCLAGMAGKDSLMLHLVTEPTGEGQVQINGYLHFGSGLAPLQVFSEPGACTDSLIQLEVANIQNGESGRISLMLQHNGNWEGIFNGFAPKPLKTVLSVVHPAGGLAFSSVHLDSTIRYKPDSVQPVARFGYHFLFSKGNDWLKDSVLAEIHGDSLCRAGGWDIRQVFNKQAERFAGTFREDADAFASDSMSFASLNYSQLFSPEVFYNQNGIFSLGLASYQYSGGAHGILFTRCMNFDLRARKRLKLQDLFIPGFEARLKAELNAAAKARYKVKDLSEILLVSEIEPNDNFYLAKNGICFSFLPYEIAPFSMGEPLFYLPYSRLKDICKK